MMRIMIYDFLTLTVWALLLDDRPSSTAFGTCCLRLGKHSREDLLFDESDTLAIAARALVDIAVRRGSGASAVVAKNFFPGRELIEIV